MKSLAQNGSTGQVGDQASLFTGSKSHMWTLVTGVEVNQWNTGFCKQRRHCGHLPHSDSTGSGLAVSQQRKCYVKLFLEGLSLN